MFTIHHPIQTIAALSWINFFCRWVNREFRNANFRKDKTEDRKTERISIETENVKKKHQRNSFGWTLNPNLISNRMNRRIHNRNWGDIEDKQKNKPRESRSNEPPFDYEIRSVIGTECIRRSFRKIAFSWCLDVSTQKSMLNFSIVLKSKFSA